MKGMEEDLEVLGRIFKEAAADPAKAKQKLNAYRNNSKKKFENGELRFKKSFMLYGKALELL